MSFVPMQNRGLGMPPVVGNLLFWVLIVTLAVVLWQASSRRQSEGAATTSLSYSDFMKQVDAKGVQSARFTLSQNTADVSGTLKQGGQRYSTTVPRDTASDLIDSLRDAGVDVQVAEAKTWQEEFVAVAPIILLIGFWIFVMRQKMRAKQQANTPNQPSPGALG